MCQNFVAKGLLLLVPRSICIWGRYYSVFGRVSRCFFPTTLGVEGEGKKMADGDGGSVYGALGSKFSSGAAKLGKKAAQSEAGRSAGKAAIKGAAEGAQKDLTDRYLRPGEGGSTPEPPQPKEPVKQEASHSHTSISSTTSHSMGSYTPSHDTQRHPRPPKPSVLARFKPTINIKKTTKPEHVKRRVPPHERVYSHRVVKTADWDRLLMCQALYNFKEEMPCDLEFRKGQVIQIVTRTENQFDWWEGKIEDRVGIFPANYVKLL